MLLAGLVWFSVADRGGFDSTGRHIEFADRFGWRSYQADFDFALDEGKLAKSSKLRLEITRRDGSTWRHVCKQLLPRVAAVPGFGTSVIVECRIKPKEFAKAVGLDREDVGEPSLIYHAMVQDGKARPGAQRALFFQPTAQLAASELAAYAGGAGAPAVLFRSN